MIDQSYVHRGTRLLLIAAALVIVIWGIYQAQSVLVLFLVSIFLSIIGRVPVLWMERKRIPRIVAVLVVVAAMVAFLLGIGAVVGASLSSFSNALPIYQARMLDMLIAFKVFLAGKGVVITDKILLGFINPGTIMNLTAALFTGLSSVLSNIFLILFTVTFILLEASNFPSKLRSVLDKPQAAFPEVAKFARDIKHYMVIKTVINLIAGTLIAVWLWILGVDFPVLWGFLVFLLQFVPGVGSIVAAVPAILFALIQLGGGAAALAAAGYLVIGTILGNIVEPKIMGRRLGLSMLVVFASLIFWGNLLGLVGALLCVPLTMTLKLACEASEDTRWIAVLLGPEIYPERIPADAKE
jgi:AI-2 transport protein TqsA